MTRIYVDIGEREVVLTNMAPGDDRIPGIQARIVEKFGVTFTGGILVDRDNPRELNLFFTPVIPRARAEEAYRFSSALERDLPHRPTPPPPTMDDVISAMAAGIKNDVDAKFLQDLDNQLREVVYPTPSEPSPMKRIYDGLTILLKYDPEGDCAAEHDVLYAGGGDPKEMSPEDLAKLDELGWHWDEDLDSWAHYV